MQVQHKKRKKILLPVIILIAVVVAGYFGVAYATKAVWPFAQTKTTDNSQTNNTNDINYNPPTDQETDSSQDGKKDNNNQSTTPPTKVSVDISYSGKSNDGQNIEVRAFTTDVIEGDGTCTATLTKGSAKVAATSDGFIDATSTICQPIEIPLSKFGSSGTWQLVVTYSSKAVSGTSDTVEVNL